MKPQFEAGRVEASRGRGVIRDPDVHRRTLGEVAAALDDAGAVIMGAMPSPITGPPATSSSSSTPAPRPPGPAPRGLGGRSTAPPRRRRGRGPPPTRAAGADRVARIAFATSIPDRPEAADLAERAAPGWPTTGPRGRTAAVADPGGSVDLDGADLLVSLGGDGTLLRAVDSAARPGPCRSSGSTSGLLGYLTEVEPAGLEDALERFLAGDYEVEERMTLAVAVRGPADGTGVGRPVRRTQRGDRREDGARAHRPGAAPRSTSSPSSPTPPTGC